MSRNRDGETRLERKYGPDLILIVQKLRENIKINSKSGCYEWIKSKDKDGYGQVRVGKTQKRPHRIMYRLLNGEIPASLHVLHRCDNPSCCRPSHLFLGTQADNVRDRNKKNRQVKGENQRSAKLTVGAVLEIRSKYKMGGHTHRDLAREYGINHSNIGCIIRRTHWRHV